MTKHLSAVERKKQIIEAALACFYKNGYINTTIDDIGKACSLSKGSIYWHFKKKDDIVYEAIKMFTAEFDEYLNKLLLNDKTSAETLRDIFKMCTSFQNKNQGMFPLLSEFWAQSSEKEEVKKYWGNMLQAFRAAVEQVINNGISSGEFISTDAQSFSWALLATLDGLGAYLSFIDELDIEKILNVYLNTLLKGLSKNA